MRAIINGKLYDTEKSEIIFQKTGLEIHMTEKRIFFVKETKDGIEKIRGMEYGENTVKELLGEKDVDKYIEIFGEPEVM